MAGKRIALLGSCALAWAMPVATASAQSPEGHGIAGFWSMSFGPTPPRRSPTPTESELMPYFPDDAIVLADAGSTEFSPGDYGGLALHEGLREAAKDYDPQAQTTVSLTCRPPGLIYSMQGPFPIEIFQGQDLIVVKLEYFDLVRVIFMNETQHPDDWPHSHTGHSIGRWDGDTLVVDTVKLTPGTLFNNGVDHTQDVRLVERFRLADPNTLVVTQQFEDPGSFEGTAARVVSFTRGQDHVYPYDCDDQLAFRGLKLRKARLPPIGRRHEVHRRNRVRGSRRLDLRCIAVEVEAAQILEQARGCAVDRRRRCREDLRERALPSVFDCSE